MRPFFVFILSFFLGLVQAQEIERRMIIFGDAGEINATQQLLIQKAQDLVLKDKTHAFFVGDNIYPDGMALEDKEKEKTENILKSQFEDFRKAGVPVYFLAGNHDWDHSGKRGLEKVKAQAHYLAQFQERDLKFVPQAGTLGPEPIQLAKDVIAITFDSEYWLFPQHGKDIKRDKEDFIEELNAILEKNHDKTILIFSHHPMKSYGEHSLKYNWKDHLFPLTRLWKPLYIPLPAVGSLYPLVRSTAFKSAEDLKHPLYKEMIAKMTATVADHPNVLFVAGHDHGLQYIETATLKQVVSGSGAKHSSIQPSKNLMYSYEDQGFCVIDYLDDRNLLLSFYVLDGQNSLINSFKLTIKHQAVK